MSTTTISPALQKRIDQQFAGSYTYEEFRQFMNDLHEKGLVTGTNQSEDLLEYSKMNGIRMSRWDKHFQLESDLSDLLKKVNSKQTWLVITEGWCGDSAQILPILQKMKEANDHIDLRIVLRDENLDLMDEYLTNGGRSIPIVVILDEIGQEIKHWGPRPAAVQEIILSMKNSVEPHYSDDEIKEKIHLWYARDKALEIQKEWKKIIELSL